MSREYSLLKGFWKIWEVLLADRNATGGCPRTQGGAHEIRTTASVKDSSKRSFKVSVKGSFKASSKGSFKGCFAGSFKGSYLRGLGFRVLWNSKVGSFRVESFGDSGCRALAGFRV